MLIALAKGLHAYGTPAHRLEQALEAVGRSLAVEARFLATPTSVQMAFGPEVAQQSVLLRVEPGEQNLEKLARLQEIMSELLEGRLDVAEAPDRIEAVASARLRYGTLTTVVAYVLVASTAAILFGGGTREAGTAAVIGGALGALAVAAVGRPRAATAYPVMAAFLATLIAYAVAPWLAPLEPFLASLAGMIVLVPGLTVTIAVSELAARHLVSGTARLTGAITTFLQIGIGVALAWKAVAAFGPATPTVAPAALGTWATVAAVPPAAAGLTVIFRARPTDYPSILFAASLALATARWGTQALGAEVGAAVSAFALGIAANALSRITRRPAAIPLLPGLLMLVPGAVGFRSVAALLREDLLGGVEAASGMALIAVSIVTGLFLASLALRPRSFV